MQKYIFKHYDDFLESMRNSVIKLFKRDNLKNNKDQTQLNPLELIELEIKKQKENLKQKEQIEKKEEIRKKILHLYVSKKALETPCKYIKRASDILKDETEDSAYEALDYLNRVPVVNLTSEDLNEMHIFKALIYELLEDYDEASKEYKKALKYDKTPNSLKIYKKFVERSREIMNWYKEKEGHGGAYNISLIHKITHLKDMPKVVDSLENIAKYYARSPKSRTLSKRYFREVLKMLKFLAENEPEKYTCKYIEALLDAIEIFMMPPLLLREASELLSANDCKESRIYLVERIKNLRKKGFIKNSINIKNSNKMVA